MTTAVSGLVKIGKTGTANYQERMRFLEANGYYNVAGLKRYFAIELEDYDDKESLLHDLLKQLLLSFDGNVIYPEKVDKEKEFDEVATVRKQSAKFSFYRKGLSNGNVVSFVSDDTITATVIGEREVEYGGQEYKLSPLTYKIFEDKGQLNSSGAYQGAYYWQYNGKRLKDLPDIS